MRILHTADWHLGRLFYGTYLTEEQAYVLEKQFLQVIKDEKIDAVIIAGDLYDRAVPPPEAVELWDMVMAKLSLEYNVPTFVIAGNHDSAQRIEVGSKFLAKSNMFVFGQIKSSLKPIRLCDQWGNIDFCLFPFSEPPTVRATLLEHVDVPIDKRVSYDSVYQIYSDYLRKQIKPGHRSIAVAHLFVAGGLSSESERPLAIGGSEQVSPSIFSDFNYTALGHLHGPQSVRKETIRYSGSLLKYSFDESKQQKHFTVIDLQADGSITTKFIPIEFRKNVSVIKGIFADLLSNTKLQEKYDDDYLLIQLEDTAPVIDALARLRQVYPSVMTIELTGRMAKKQQVSAIPNFNYQNLDERMLFNQFAEYAWRQPLTEEEQAYMDKVWQELLQEI